MKDNADKRLDDLYATVRQAAPDTSRLEYGFEARLLARLRVERLSEPWFARAWQLCPVFAGIVASLGIWAYCSPPEIDLPSLVKNSGDESQLVEYLTGKQI